LGSGCSTETPSATHFRFESELDLAALMLDGVYFADACRAVALAIGADGMLNAEPSFRRLRGYQQMPTSVAALARQLEAVPPACDAARVV
jgi:hypothetical protein